MAVVGIDFIVANFESSPSFVLSKLLAMMSKRYAIVARLLDWILNENEC